MLIKILIGFGAYVSCGIGFIIICMLWYGHSKKSVSEEFVDDMQADGWTPSESFYGKVIWRAVVWPIAILVLVWHGIGNGVTWLLETLFRAVYHGSPKAKKEKEKYPDRKTPGEF